MLDAIAGSWTPSRWAVIKDARRRQRRRHRRFLAVVAMLLLAATVGGAIARNAGSSQAPAPASVTVGTVQPLALGGVVQGTATLEGRLWALGTETNYSISLTDPPTVGVITTLNPHTGRIVGQWPISPKATALVFGNGSAYVGDDNNGRLVRLTPPHGLQILHGPKAAQLMAVTPHALWAVNRNGQLLRIGLTQP